ncbi:MAG: type VI secretion system baseplate subunit TssK [Betaproteobacteria bacterium]
MQPKHRVLWGEGMFLRPQHFQQQALFHENNLAQAMRLIHGNPWGLREFGLDNDALRGGLLRLNKLNAIFQDGTQVVAPEAAPLPMERNLNDIAQLPSETTVFACLPPINAFGGNCCERNVAAPRPARFISEQRMLSDLYTQALEAEVSLLHPNLCLMVEQENRDGYQSIAVGRIAKNVNGLWSIDESFIPPLVDIAGSPQLQMICKRLLDILLVKSQALAASHRERVQSVVEYGTSDIASFWLLHTVNRAFPLLSHYAATPTHPEALYALLAQLCGELVTFSSTLSVSDIPAYSHENQNAVFDRLDSMIRELLETVVSNRYALIPLSNTKPSFFVGRLDSERLVENVDYYLSVSGELPTTEILERVPVKLKAGSPDDVEKILNSALPGVRLVHAQQTPSALPVRVGNHYFILEPQGQIFDRMRKARAICIYVPEALLGLQLELIAVFR